MNSGFGHVATLAEIIPSSRSGLENIPAAYIGVSIGNPNFGGSRLRALLEWVSGHVASCCLLVGIEVSRWTFMIERGVSEAEAVAIAARHARRQLADLRRSIATLPHSTVFRITTDTELRSHERFAPALDNLRKLSRKNERFAQLVELSAREYCERRFTRGRPIAVTFETALELSRQFILEELAIFSVLVALGFPIEIYPGPELPVLAAIANGEFLGAPVELQTRTNLVIDIVPYSAEEAA